MDYSQYYLEEFKKYISLQTSSTNTIKNYLSDLRVFFNFVRDHLSTPISPQTLSSLLSENSLVQYDEYLSQNSPTATGKRRTSSLKKFIEFCSTLNITSFATPPSASSATPSPYYPFTQSVTAPSISTPPPPLVSPSLPTPPQPTPPPSVPNTQEYFQPTPQPVSPPNIQVESHPISLIEPEPEHSSFVNLLPDFQSETQGTFPLPATATPPRPNPVSVPKKSRMSISLVIPVIAISFLLTFALTYLLSQLFLK